MPPRPARMVLLCLLSTVPVISAAAAPPVLSFEPKAVVASGIAPKGRAVWFSVAREISRQSATIVPRIELATDEDGDGKVRLDLDAGVPVRSIWFAVDLETGAAGVGSPEDYSPQEVTLPGKAIPAALNRLDLERKLVYLVLVRPGVGAWKLRVGDGGASDEDGQPDGTLRAALARFQGIGPAPLPPPEHLVARDLLLVIDPDHMEFMRFQVGN